MTSRKNGEHTPDAQSYNIEYEQDRRDSFRVEPWPDRPVRLKLGGDIYNVKDIGAGGAAFVSEAHPGRDPWQGLILLPDRLEDEAPAARIFLVERRQDGLTRVIFRDMTRLDKEKIHQYVLERQKEELEMRRRERSRKT